MCCPPITFCLTQPWLDFFFFFPARSNLCGHTPARVPGSACVLPGYGSIGGRRGGGNNEFMRSSINLSLRGMKAGLALVFNVHGSSEKTRRFLCDTEARRQERNTEGDGGAHAVERNGANTHFSHTHTDTDVKTTLPPPTAPPAPSTHTHTSHERGCCQGSA